MRWLPLLLLACATDVPEPTASCVSCHGSTATGPAPPNALGGNDDPSSRGVGAHTAHLQASVSAPVACTECHAVPATVDAPGHIDDGWPADLLWGTLTTTDGATATWDGATLTCSGSYCHGATMAAPGPDPVWTDTGTSCASCHLFPPPAPHPATGPCGDCHAPTAVGMGLGDSSTHIDGILQVQAPAGSNCAAGCHGDDDQPAPPFDLAGNSDTSLPGVGAHAVHLSPSLGAAVPCSACHPIPGGANDAGVHLEGTNDVVFDGIANNGNTTSSYDAATTTCSTYCHGASMAGGTVQWTVVDGSQLGCTDCHGNPPPPPHPGSTSCSGCHTTGGSGDPAAHIDGAVNF